MKPAHITPEQAMFDHGVELAYQANEAFDEKQAATDKLQALQVAGNIPGVEVAPEARSAVQDELVAAHQRHEQYTDAVGALIGPKVFKNPETGEQTSESIDVFSLMTPEQQETATKLRGEMAKRFEKLGVTEDTLQVVKTETETGETAFTLLHTGAGIDIGDQTKDYDLARSYKAAMSEDNDKLFVFEIDGKTYDARTGMTDAAYTAKYEYARENNMTLPDSQQMADETDDVRTWTMLTAEPLTADGVVQLRYVYDGRVYQDFTYPGNGDRDLRVCPAVVIE